MIRHYKVSRAQKAALQKLSGIFASPSELGLHKRTLDGLVDNGLAYGMQISSSLVLRRPHTIYAITEKGRKLR